MQRVTKDVLYFSIGPENEPTVTVEPGEEFEVQTQMNRGPWLDTHPDGERLRSLLTGGNPSSGCIYVRGAKPGDMITIHIGDIRLSNTGFTRFAGSNGALPGWLGASGVGEHHRVVRIDEGMIVWSDDVLIPVKPMIGYVGVAPARERMHNGWGGYWGGNLDIQEVTTDARVHLPVQVEGALLQIGDMHAVQGDGEICGAGGIETEGMVRVRCELGKKPESMDGPRIENETHIIAVGLGKPAEDAFRAALSSLILWLEEEFGLSRGDAYLLLGQVLEARCTQFVNPTFTYVAKAARMYLPARRAAGA